MADAVRLPERTEVAIVGGGIAGIAAALALSELGVPCLVLEKGRVAAEQSSRNWGWVRMLGRAEAEIPLMGVSQSLWRRYADEAPGTGFRQAGITYLAETEGDMARHGAWREMARAHQIAPNALTARQAAELAGRDDARLLGGMTLTTDCHAEPRTAVPALAARARALGADIREGVAVRGLLREGGRATGVVTEAGTVRASAVILAGGAWSRTLLENEGLSFPQLGIRSSVLRTTPVARFTEGPIGATSASVRPRADGGMTVAVANHARFDLIPAAFAHLRAFAPVIRERWRMTHLRLGPDWFGPLGRRRWDLGSPSPFEEMRVMDPAPEPAILRRAMEGARGLYPALAGARVAQSWAGVIDVMPDEEPVIGPSPIPGLTICTGFSGHGFGIGPGAGLLAAQMATGRPTCVDPAPFRWGRFA